MPPAIKPVNRQHCASRPRGEVSRLLPAMTTETIWPFGMSFRQRLASGRDMALETVFLDSYRLVIGITGNPRIPVFGRRQERDPDNHGSGKQDKEPIDLAQSHRAWASFPSAAS